MSTSMPQPPAPAQQGAGGKKKKSRKTKKTKAKAPGTPAATQAPRQPRQLSLAENRLVPSTKEGLDWVKEYLHPPHREGMDLCRGIPDMSTQSSAVLRWVNKQKFGPPAGLAAGETWSILVVSLPNPQYPVVAFRWAGDDPPTVYDPANTVWMENRQFVFGLQAENWETAVQATRPLANSVTTELITSDLYNQGQVAVCKVPVQNAVHPVDQGGDFPLADVLAVSTELGLLPTEQGLILQASCKSADWEAKFGSFQILNFVSPAVQYESAAAVRGLLNFKLRSVATPVEVPFGGVTNADAPTYSGMTAAYTLYTGLLSQATISVKRNHAWECVLPANSVWQPFATAGPMPDAAAMELAAVQMHALPDGLTAAHNSFGSFFSKLLPVAKGIWNVAGPLVKAGVSALPGGSAINAGIGLAEKLAGAAGL